jgi:hypothetical protein
MSDKFGFDAYIKRIMKEDEELLKILGSDFDEEGIPYWEKWGSESKFDAEFDVDKNTNNTVI